jgi:hypothetical protein
MSLIEQNLITYNEYIEIKDSPREVKVNYNPCTVEYVYNVQSVQEFEQLVKICGWFLNRKHNLTIVTWQHGANTAIRPSVKGLIYNHTNGEIMAPGVPVPLDNEPSEHPVAYSNALDGVMFRIWYSPTKNSFACSTNGKIRPGSWRGADLKALMTQCITLKQINMDNLNVNFCYLVVLEDPSIPNIYKAETTKLTLVRVLYKTGVDVPLVESVCSPFTHLNIPRAGDFQIPEPDRPAPATRNTYGKIAHYRNGDTYRILSQNSKNAELFRPNFSEVWQHWIYHVMYTNPDEWDFGALEWYKTYFPWAAAEIDGLTACFKSIVPPPEQQEILESPEALKRIVDTYKKTLEEIQEFIRHEDNSVTVKHLGQFFDDEAADRNIEYYLRNPALIFN